MNDAAILIGPGGGFLFALALAAVSTAVLRRLLIRMDWVDAPRVDRWHRTPVPRPGGPAIFLTFLVGFLVFVPHPWSRQMWGLLVGGTYFFVVGLIDDLTNLPNPLKLTLLIVGATIPLGFGVTFGLVAAPIGVSLALLWILGLTNAVNWLDNMDGLAAGTSAIAAGTLIALSAGFSDTLGSTLAALVAGACLGFLIFNFSPAKIFMGDSGSGFLGFVLAVITLLGPARHVANTLLALIVPAMVLSIPIFDMAVVTLARLFSSRRLFQGGRDHPSHRLVVLGLSERQAVLYLYGLSLLAAMTAVVTSQLGVWTGLALAGILACLFTAVGVVVMGVRVYTEAVPSTGTKVVLSQVMYKSRLLQILADLILLCVAYIGAYLLRFDGTIPPAFVPAVVQSFPLVVGVKMAVLYLSGAYRGDWHYVGLLDVLGIVRASALGSVAVVIVLVLWTRLSGYSRAVFVIDWILTIGLLTSMRLSVSLLQEYIASQRIGGKRVLIVGAGQGGVQLLQELRHNPALAYRPVGFVDDDPVRAGAVIRGLPVLGSPREIPVLARTHRIEEVLVAAPSMRGEEIDRIQLICNEAGIRCRVTRPLLARADEWSAD